MTAKYRVTSRARDDLKQIGLYTQNQYGKTQRNQYLKRLEKRFAWLAENPKLGKHRRDIHHGYYSYPQDRHVIFYLIHPSGIDIIGVPHKSMDIVPYFSDPPFPGH